MVLKNKVGRPKGDELLEKVTINVRRGDPKWFEIMKGPGKMSKFLRDCLSEYVDREQAPEPMDIDTTLGSLKDE